MNEGERATRISWLKLKAKKANEIWSQKGNAKFLINKASVQLLKWIFNQRVITKMATQAQRLEMRFSFSSNLGFNASVGPSSKVLFVNVALRIDC